MPRILIAPPLTVASFNAGDPLTMTYRDVPEGSPLLVDCPACASRRGVDCVNPLSHETRSRPHVVRTYTFANCEAILPGFGDFRCSRATGHEGDHVHVYEDGSATEWSGNGDADHSRVFAEGMFTRRGERTNSDLAPIEPESIPADGPLSILCPSCFRGAGRPCVDLSLGGPRSGPHSMRIERASTCFECGEFGHTLRNCPSASYCGNCDSRGHEDIDCPVGEDEEPEYDQADYCTCDNCVAASEYVPGVE